MEPFVIILFVIVLVVLLASIKVVGQASVKIIERLGKYKKTAAAGLNIILPFLDRVRMTRDLREQMFRIKPQQVITRDNVTMEVDCVIYWQIFDPVKATYGITDVQAGVDQLTLSAIRAVIGDLDLDHTLSQRESINVKLSQAIGSATENWGVRVLRVELIN